MIVTRIEAANFRSLVEPLAAELAPAGINLICAPNGSGKSTLIEALRMAFLISHKSASEDIKAIVPWGRALAPRVAVEFEAGSSRRRASKQWLEGASALLEEWRAGNWHRIAEGAAADEQLRHAAGMPAGFDKGAKGRDEFWTSVLWCVQGGLKLDNVDGSVLGSVRASLNQQMESGAAARVLKLIEETASLYWTPTGRTAKRSPVAALQARLAEARQRASAAGQKLRELERLRGDLLDMEQERRRFAESLPALEEKLHEAAAAINRRGVLQVAHDKEQAAYDLLLQQARRMQDDLQRWQQATGRLSENQARAAELEAGAPPPSGGLDEALAAAGAKLKAAHAYLAARKEREDARAHLARCEQLADEIRQPESALAALAAPTAGAWTQLQKLNSEAVTTRARLDAALVHLEVRVERPIELTVIAGEPEGARTLAPGESLRVSGSPAVEVHAAGIGAWRASGPTASANELRAALARLEQQWASSTARFGAQSYEALEARRIEAAQLEASLQEARARLHALLDGGSIETLRRKLLDVESACAAHEGQYADWAAKPPDPETIEKELQALRALREAALLREQMRADQAQIDGWAAACGSIAALAQRLDEATLRLRGIELQLKEHAAELGRFAPDLDAEAERLTQELATAKQRLDGSLANSQLIRGRIEQLAAEAPYQSLAEAEEEGDELARDVVAQMLAASAALLLRDTAAECSTALLEDISAAVAHDAGALLRAITGTPLGELRLNPGLAPDALVPASWNEAVELAQLSGGENEQIHFATRLALADRLAAHEPQLVVFDDVLMATDPARLARILDLLDQRRERLQVLILTCHPERFSALAGAHRVNFNRPCPSPSGQT